MHPITLYVDFITILRNKTYFCFYSSRLERVGTERKRGTEVQWASRWKHIHHSAWWKEDPVPYATWLLPDTTASTSLLRTVKWSGFVLYTLQLKYPLSTHTFCEVYCFSKIVQTCGLTLKGATWPSNKSDFEKYHYRLDFNISKF